jgi:hypothetical protein
MLYVVAALFSSLQGTFVVLFRWPSGGLDEWDAADAWSLIFS